MDAYVIVIICVCLPICVISLMAVFFCLWRSKNSSSRLGALDTVMLQQRREKVFNAVKEMLKAKQVNTKNSSLAPSVNNLHGHSPADVPMVNLRDLHDFSFNDLDKIPPAEVDEVFEEYGGSLEDGKLDVNLLSFFRTTASLSNGHASSVHSTLQVDLGEPHRDSVMKAEKWKESNAESVFGDFDDEYDGDNDSRITVSSPTTNRMVSDASAIDKNTRALSCGSYESASSEPASMLPSSRHFLGVLEVELLSLRTVDHAAYSKGIAAFLVVSHGTQCYRSVVTKKGWNHVFNQRAKVFLHEGEDRPIVISLYAKKKSRKNKLVGRGIIEAGSFSDFEVHELWLPLRSTSNNVRNNISEFNHMNVCFRSCFVGYDSSWEVQLRAKCESREDLKISFWRNLFSATWEGDVVTRSDLIDDLGFLFVSSNNDNLTVSDIVSSWIGPDVDTIPISELPFLMVGLPNSDIIFDLRTCPLCYKPLPFYTLAMMNHLDTCSAIHLTKKSNQSDGCIMESFFAESHAIQGWISRIFRAPMTRFISSKIANNTSFIMVHNRHTRLLEKEQIPKFIKAYLRMLQTRLGRSSIKKMSKFFERTTRRIGEQFSSPKSKMRILRFIAYHQLDPSEFLDPVDSFNSFNDFFIRKLKPGVRLIDAPNNDRIAVSPADCRLLVFPTVDDATSLWIKGRSFSISELLHISNASESTNAVLEKSSIILNTSEEYWSEIYELFAVACSIVICRLAPQDYHRFHTPVTGTIKIIREIEGMYYTVNPLAVRNDLDIFTLNKRAIVEIDSPVFGTVLFVPIGATMVGSIIFTVRPGDDVNRGDEIGYFQFGGSTILLLFSGNITFDDDLLLNSSQPLETLIRMGNTIGQVRNRQKQVYTPPT